MQPIVIHLFHFIDSNGEILAPLVDVVHQAQGQILEDILDHEHFIDDANLN